MAAAEATAWAPDDEAPRPRDGSPCPPSPEPPRGRIEPAAAAPDPGRRAKVARQGQRRVRRDGALAMHDLTDPQRRHTDIDRDPVLREPKRLHEFFQDFTGMDGESVIMADPLHIMTVRFFVPIYR